MEIIDTSRNYIFTDGSHIPVGTMYCIGRNYAAHAREMGAEVPSAPLVFLKPPAAYLPDGHSIRIPSISQNMHHELEMVVVIGKDGADIPVVNALDYVAGYAVGIDFTLRDIQAIAKQKGEPWAVAKGFVGSAPISKVVPAHEVSNSNDISLQLIVNQQVRQIGTTSMMERTVEELIAYLSSIFSLRRGDCIFTGTPKGVSQVKSGDCITCTLEDFTTLSVTIQ
ncbi:MAG: fumarylacetoacetate hydrolase family protein [Ignavibacteria bacterium]|nr:fumarylacetoacetate hydrolase family protein [Ignavibacteria bacterium]